MKQARFMGIRTKIILSTVICVVLAGLISNFFLYHYLDTIIEEKVDNINTLYAETIGNHVIYNLEKVRTLKDYCAYSEDVLNAMQYGVDDSLAAKRSALTAQSAVNAYLMTSTIESYINKLVLFTEDGMLIHAMSNLYGRQLDHALILQSEQFARWKNGTYKDFDKVYASVDPFAGDCFALFANIYGPDMSTPIGYAYIEVSTAIVNDILAPYNELNIFFAETTAGSRLIPVKNMEFLELAPENLTEKSFSYNGNFYAAHPVPLNQFSLTLYGCVNETELQTGNTDILFSVVSVIMLILFVVVAILFLLTHYITTPINRIMNKINKLALNDFTPDPELEKPKSEMGEIGARLNELAVSFSRLLTETIELHEQRSKTEMALLQSQVNPHFLYNTLNSVHYMALAQKNMGIVKIVHSLVNLLKNISKGVSDKITLAEELSLLQDYVSIQEIRYIGSFDYQCNIPDEFLSYTIVKFSLQPIVENAIFHGIVPKGTFGTITVDAHEEEEFLIITVTDNGLGMTEEEISRLMSEKDSTNKSAMSGIGMSNVGKRLRLSYGRESGITVESEKGSYTAVHLKIRKEKEEE